MGISDAGCYGGEIRTPNFDKLAKGGLRDWRTVRFESRNLAADHPDQVEELEQAWTQQMEEFHTQASQDLRPGP